MSVHLRVADAVAAEINSAVLPFPVTADRKFIPAYELEDLKEYRVAVVPRTVQKGYLSRDSLTSRVSVDVGVHRKIDPPSQVDQDAIDDACRLVEAINDLLMIANRLTEMSEATLVEIAISPIMSEEQYSQNRVFMGIVRCVYEVNEKIKLNEGEI